MSKEDAPIDVRIAKCCWSCQHGEDSENDVWCVKHKRYLSYYEVCDDYLEEG